MAKKRNEENKTDNTIVEEGVENTSQTEKQAKKAQPKSDNNTENSDNKQEQGENVQVQPTELEQKQAEIVALNKELEAQKAQYLRLRADFDNYRRNKDSETAKAKSLGMIMAIEQILPAMDSFDRALASELSEKEKEGITLIKKQLDDALKKLGVEEIKALGEDFNPKFHYAVMSVEDSEQEGKVLEVFQKGYMLGKDIIRYSMVKVAN